MKKKWSMRHTEKEKELKNKGKRAMIELGGKKEEEQMVIPF